MHSYNSEVRLDDVHIDLIVSVVKALNANDVLELGFGSGALAEKIYGFPANHIVVDNWYDWNGSCPISKADYSKITFVESNEHTFIKRCCDKYDVIVSDADHFNSHLWFEDTLALLKDKGVCFFHDVSNPYFKNLETIYTSLKQKQNCILFNSSIYPFNRCDRGLLMVVKDA